jgi:hypothetical protein
MVHYVGARDTLFHQHQQLGEEFVRAQLRTFYKLHA